MEPPLSSELAPDASEHDQWFREEVQKGLAQLDRGDSIAHEEMVARVERLLDGSLG
jgi:predicted transcriptional regulator